MITTAVPVSHNGLTAYSVGSPSGGASPPQCFLGFLGTGCAVDPSHWIGAQGAGQASTDIGDSFVLSAKGIKDFAASGDKIALLLPFLVLMLAFGLAIGWSKGRRYF